MKRLLTVFIMAVLVLSCTTVSASARHGCRAADTVCGGFRAECGPAACLGQQRVRVHNCVDGNGDGVNYDPARCPGGGTGGGTGGGNGCGSGMGCGNGGHHGGGYC